MPHILIVEDDTTFAMLLKTWLGKKGYRADTAGTVAAAARMLFAADSVDVVLSDLRLPDHDGLELLGQMRKRGLRQPFIVMTSYAEVQNAVLAIFARQEPEAVTYGIGIEEHDHEGRVITLTYPDFYLVTVYTPNSQRELTRLEYRMRWEDDFRAYLNRLAKDRGVIVCGDLNVAHQEIDLKNPRTNRNNAGFTDQERGKMTKLLESGFTDSYRWFYPDQEGAYSWWSYQFHAREKNAGWRIDYFLVSESLKERMRGAAIHAEIPGSDHCPVELVLD